MSRMPASEAEKLAGLLSEEAELLNEFLALTRKQAESLAAEDVDGFSELLKKRSGLIKKVDALKPKLEALEKVKADARVGKLRSSIRETLLEIDKISNSNRDALKKLMSQLGDDIKKLAESQKLLEGYGQTSLGVSSEYFDKRF